MTRAVDIIRRAAPKAKKNYIAAFDQGDALLQEHGVNTPDRLAHFLAQVLHETDGLTCERESLSYSAERLCQVFGQKRHSACVTSQEAQRLARDEVAIGERVYGLGNFDKAQELGNTHPGDGFRYRGGGLLQITGRANYRRIGELCNIDFEELPELIVSPAHALKPALCVWTAARLNTYADCNDILAISRAINVGNPRSMAKPNGLQDRLSWFAKVRSLIDWVEFRTNATIQLNESQRVERRHAQVADIAALLGGRMAQAGDEDETVRAIQVVLAKIGYPLQGTGFFGPNTEAAVKDFQVKHNLEVDGVVGPETAKAIDAAAGRSGISPDQIWVKALASDGHSALGSSQDISVTPGLAEVLGNQMLQIGDQNDAVKAVQLALAQLGYRLKGTGYFGGATDTAVTHFQAMHGLEVDGVVGPKTIEAIDRKLSMCAPHGRNHAVGEERLQGQSEEDRPLWLLEALRWLDVKESPGGADNPQILEWAREEGGSIAKAFRQDSIPWCALFANMVLTKTACKGTETLWALDFANWGQKLAGPAVGAFVPMARHGGGHIAIVVGRDQHGNLMCIGGNQADAVNIKPFPKARPVGYRWPIGVPQPLNIGFEALPVVKSNGITSTREG
jgi:uncharacterized protein (TIGR02594 family)